jgi:AcrR family transcriptional regulator
VRRADDGRGRSCHLSRFTPAFSVDRNLPISWQPTILKLKKSTLQEGHATATRDLILGAAFEQLVEHRDRLFSQEAVARMAGVGAHTIYRHFQAQNDLYEALWLLVCKQSGTRFATQKAGIVPSIGAHFSAFEENEQLIRAQLWKVASVSTRA